MSDAPYILYLMRHGEAASPPDAEDAARQLTTAGMEESRRMGEWLARTHPLPAHVLCSDAERARGSYLSFCQGVGHTLPVSYHRALYLPKPGVLMDTIADVAEDVRVLLVITHNPGISECAPALIGEATPSAYAGLRRGFPTAGLAMFEFSDPWDLLDVGTGLLRDFMAPGDIEA